AKTSGGLAFSRSSAAAAAAESGHSGCCSAGRSRQVEGDQVEDVVAIAISVETGFLVYPVPVTFASRTRWSWLCGRGAGPRRGPAPTASSADPSPRDSHDSDEVNSMRVFSGIQATGEKHIGNYIGAMRNYVKTQEEGDAFFCIVDLHSITVDYDPQDLHDRTLDLAALLYAVGLDPHRSTLFLQSHVTAHSEAAWLLSAVTGFGQLSRMTQFKEKGEGKEFVSAGVFEYPVLMAGGILLYQTDIVPG